MNPRSFANFLAKPLKNPSKSLVKQNSFEVPRIHLIPNRLHEKKFGTIAMPNLLFY